MPNLVLRRFDQSVNGTFGKLYDGDDLIAVTCERPDNGNQKMGCIPLGFYEVSPFNSPSKGKDFLVRMVPNRSMIEIHKGNTIKDTEGCILVGKNFGFINGMKAVLNSGIALGALLDKYPSGFNMTITMDTPNVRT